MITLSKTEIALLALLSWTEALNTSFQQQRLLRSFTGLGFMPMPATRRALVLQARPEDFESRVIGRPVPFRGFPIPDLQTNEVEEDEEEEEEEEQKVEEEKGKTVEPEPAEPTAVEEVVASESKPETQASVNQPVAAEETVSPDPSPEVASSPEPAPSEEPAPSLSPLEKLFSPPQPEPVPTPAEPVPAPAPTPAALGPSPLEKFFAPPTPEPAPLPEPAVEETPPSPAPPVVPAIKEATKTTSIKIPDGLQGVSPYFIIPVVALAAGRQLLSQRQEIEKQIEEDIKAARVSRERQLGQQNGLVALLFSAAAISLLIGFVSLSS